MIRINIKVKYPRKKWEEIERRIELKSKIKFYNKFSGDIVDIDLEIPVTEDEIRVLRKQRRDRRYYLRHKKAIRASQLRYYWRERLNKATALNEPFKCCNGHHITEDFVVYIPPELHRKFPHSVKLSLNMDKINNAVILYLRDNGDYAVAALVKEHLASTQ